MRPLGLIALGSEMPPRSEPVVSASSGKLEKIPNYKLSEHDDVGISQYLAMCYRKMREPVYIVGFHPGDKVLANLRDAVGNDSWPPNVFGIENATALCTMPNECMAAAADSNGIFTKKKGTGRHLPECKGIFSRLAHETDIKIVACRVALNSKGKPDPRHGTTRAMGPKEARENNDVRNTAGQEDPLYGVDASGSRMISLLAKKINHLTAMQEMAGLNEVIDDIESTPYATQAPLQPWSEAAYNALLDENYLGKVQARAPAKFTDAWVNDAWRAAFWEWLNSPLSSRETKESWVDVAWLRSYKALYYLTTSTDPYTPGLNLQDFLLANPQSSASLWDNDLITFKDYCVTGGLGGVKPPFSANLVDFLESSIAEVLRLEAAGSSLEAYDKVDPSLSADKDLAFECLRIALNSTLQWNMFKRGDKIPGIEEISQVAQQCRALVNNALGQMISEAAQNLEISYAEYLQYLDAD